MPDTVPTSPRSTTRRASQDEVRGRNVEYSVGFAITEKIRDAIKLVPAKVWNPATDAEGGIREGGDVAERHCCVATVPPHSNHQLRSAGRSRVTRLRSALRALHRGAAG